MPPFAGTVPLTTTQTADDGSFSLTSKDGSSLTLLIENVGYTSSDISLEGVKKSIDLGTIYLSDAKDLQELVVTADGRRESRGKTIVIPSATDVKASSDALSLLRKLQLDELEINPVNRSMSVMGASVVILIDGIPPRRMMSTHSIRLTYPKWNIHVLSPPDMPTKVPVVSSTSSSKRGTTAVPYMRGDEVALLPGLSMAM